MILTPTTQSSAIAGFALWFVGWMTFFKLDKLPVIGRFISKDKMTSWISSNKVLTLLCTEVFNFGVHGISNPASVTFALGGTVMNALMIFVLLPMTIWHRKASRASLLQGNF